MALLVAASAVAQDSYREALKGYLSLSDQPDGMETIRKALNDLNGSVIEQSDNVDLEQLTERYIKECFFDHLVDMVEPMMKERGVTEADLKTASAMNSTPEGQTFLAHQREANKKLREMLLREMLPEEPSFETPEEVAKIPVNPNIDAEYAAKFKKMMEVSGIKQQMMSSVVDGLFPQQWREVSEDAKDLIDYFKKWMDDNLTAVSLNSAYGIMTLEDLDYGTMLYSNESYHKITTMSPSGMDFSDIMGRFGHIFGSYIDWMESHGAQLSEKARGLKYLLNMMENNRPNEEP